MKVSVYRNVTNGKLSIKYKNKVVGHCDEITMTGCIFSINKAGQKRVRDSGQKNVHALISGTILNCKGFNPFRFRELPENVCESTEYTSPAHEIIKYNPYLNATFIREIDNREVLTRFLVTVTKDGLIKST